MLGTAQQRAFAKANLRYFLTGHIVTRLGNTPKPDHIIPKDFSCIGVATSTNPKSDTYILSQLSALKIKRVRLDFTYGDFDQPAGRLLPKLVKAGLLVHLHLVQPFHEAKAMRTDEAKEAWRQFLTNVCKFYGDDVALIEIGSTVNRKRWAGYDLQRLMTMWQIAHEVVKAHNVTLAGPNVTDFEPVYNIGLLSAFQLQDKLPDIHTNNLFSERCTEPERNDHKIIGRTLAGLGRYKLIKKAHVLDNITRYFGINSWHSPSAFWTIPRIERLLPDSLQKQADYLSRYFILCAASGTMQSAGWGPMICHREGLIDDQIKPYPSLERITHYQDISDEVEHYHLRPAFKAFTQVNKALQGAHYIGKVGTQEGLEVHAFQNETGYWHAAWTINGKTALMSEIYQDLSGLQATLSRDGEIIDRPDLLTESPIFMRFEASPTTKPNAGTIKHCSIHRYANNTHFYQYQQGNWRGLIAAKNAKENALLQATLDPTQLRGPTKETTLRKARNAIWTIPDPRDTSKQLVVKQPIRVPGYKKLTDHFKPSKALRSWTGANELLRRGINNASPVAYLEHIDDTGRTKNYYLCEYVPADFSVREMFVHFANGNTSYEDISRENAFKQVAEFLNNMHQRGVFFRDLSGGNILINKLGDEQLEFSLIDTGRAHFFNHPTAMKKRLSDMARACNKLDTQGRNQLMQHYMQKQGKAFSWQYKLPFITYNLKVKIKRETKLKNILKRLGLKKKQKP